jgi:hypothetical protein
MANWPLKRDLTLTLKKKSNIFRKIKKKTNSKKIKKVRK